MGEQTWVKITMTVKQGNILSFEGTGHGQSKNTTVSVQ